MPSTFSAPNPILFGTGVSGLTGEKLKALGCTKVLVVYDEGIKAAGLVDKIVKVIHAAGIETVHYSGVLADPPDWSVEEAGALGVSEKVDGVVGLGGGSAIDTAKGAVLLQANPPPISQYYGREGVITVPSKPLVVIPTTAGTGSECTPGGVITDTKNVIKTNIAGAGCKVSLGLIDPELTLGLPPAVTAATGMDALCHAAESYTSALSNVFCDLTGREAILLAGKYLVRAFEDGSDLEAREGMMKAATLGGMSMSGPLCHLAHDIGKAMGGKFSVPHGNACASCLPQVLETVAPAVPGRVRYIAESFGAVIAPDASNEQIGEAARLTIQGLMKKLRLPNMRELGLDKPELLATLPEIVTAMQAGLSMMFGQGTCPVPVSKELIASIISRAYDEN
jgi:alcohol dehydrogenase class IV